MAASGVGNFVFRWRPRDEAGDALRVRVRYTGESIDTFGTQGPGFTPDDLDLAVEFLGPDSIRVDGRAVLSR